jgi:SAM-dependent methyltransferase
MPAKAYACTITESFFDLPFQKKTFDSIFYFGLHESMDLQNARQLMCDAARVVKPAGIVVLVVAQQSQEAGAMERPAGEQDIVGGWKSTIYTSEQQKRLHVDSYGVPVSDSSLPKSVSQSPFTNFALLDTTASTCGFEVTLSLPVKSFTGFFMKLFFQF